MTTLHLRKSIGSLPWALAVCLTLATLGLALSVNANERNTTFITFDAPGAGTGPFQGTFGIANNPAGAITGYYADASNLNHGFLRAPDGTLTTIDVPGARQTFPESINPSGAIAGFWGFGGVLHGFLRAPNGTFMTFDAPGAGTGLHQGTTVNSVDCLNDAGSTVGSSLDASNVYHSFVRAPDGAITVFDVPGAGTGPFQGTECFGINQAGTTEGIYIDSSDLLHGFVRSPSGA